MTQAHRRRKEPEALRAELLRAAADILAELGIQGLTLERVAGRAGVSKGGLLHHFPHKNGLLDALFADAVEKFRQAVAVEAGAGADEPGAAARAYLRASADDVAAPGLTGPLHHLLAAMLTEPALRVRWSGLLRDFLQPDPLPPADAARLMICRLAADGLWFADQLGYGSLTPELRAELLRQLEAMTRRQDRAP